MRSSVTLPALFVLIWSSGYLAGTIGTRDGAPLALVAWRFLVACVLLGVVSLVTKAPWPRRPSTYLHLAVIGALLQTVQLGGAYLALARGVPAGLAALVLSVSPLVVAAAAVPLFGERLRGRQWVGLAIGLAGVVVSLGDRVTGGGQAIGYACTAVALVGFAAGTLYQKAFGGSVDLRTGTTVQLLGATVTSFPLAALHGGVALPLTASSLGALAWLATVNSIGAFVLLFVLLRRRPGGAATSLLYLVPPVTALLGVPILGQDVTPGVFAGMAISGVGVALISLRPRPARAPGYARRGIAPASRRAPAASGP